jgi:hypothetical protein
MSAGTRPRAPWYAWATRRIAFVRVGLPTLLVCIAAMAGTKGTLDAPIAAAQNVAALVSQSTSAVTRSTGRHAHGDGDGDGGRASTHSR